MIEFLYKANNVAALTTPETVPQPQLGPHMERGGALIMERAKALHGPNAGAAQRDVFTDDLIDSRLFANRINVCSNYSSATHAYDPKAQAHSGEREPQLPVDYTVLLTAFTR